MAFLLKFACIFVAFGFLFSFAFGIIGGVRFSSVLSTAFFLSIFSGILGIGSYKILEKSVPEVLGIFKGIFIGQKFAGAVMEGDMKGEDMSEDGEVAFSTAENKTSLESAAEGSSENTTMSGDASIGGKKNYGKHVLVDKIKIKNEPNVMAEAVRTMLARDEMESE